MLLWFDSLGLNRYRHRVVTPRMISGCVLDVIVRRAFPVDAEGGGEADAALVYHQYGLRQQGRPTSAHVLEDICHAFFATPTHGARPWLGAAAVFSLPKFFGMHSMSGGLVIPDASVAAAVRERRDDFEPPSASRRREQAEIFRSGAGGARLEEIYLQRLHAPKLHDDELGGLPTSLQGLRAIGAARAATLEAYLGALPGEAAKSARGLIGEWHPYALPLFVPETESQAASAALAWRGAPGASYALDIARNQAAPRYQRGFLLPCHHHVAPSQASALGRAVRAAVEGVQSRS